MRLSPFHWKLLLSAFAVVTGIGALYAYFAYDDFNDICTGVVYAPPWIRCNDIFTLRYFGTAIDITIVGLLGLMATISIILIERSAKTPKLPQYAS